MYVLLCTFPDFYFYLFFTFSAAKVQQILFFLGEYLLKKLNLLAYINFLLYLCSENVGKVSKMVLKHVGKVTYDRQKHRQSD